MGKIIFKFSITQLILLGILMLVVTQKNKVSQILFDTSVIGIGAVMLIILIIFIIKVMGK